MVHLFEDLTPIFNEIFLMVLDQMLHKKNCQERLRGGTSQKHILSGPATRKPKNMMEFLCNDENKMQLFQLILQVFQNEVAVSSVKKYETSIVVAGGKAFSLTENDGKADAQEIHELTLNQEETDKRVILYLKYAAQKGFNSAVLRIPDTDIFFILLYHVASIGIEISLDTGKQRRLINISEIAREKDPDYCTALLEIYVFTGEDGNRVFMGKGKINPLKKLNANRIYHFVFKILEEEWTVSDDICSKIEVITCLMFGYTRQKRTNVVRAKMLRKMYGEDKQLTIKSKLI